MAISYGNGGGNFLANVQEVPTFIPGDTDVGTAVIVTVISTKPVFSVIDSKNNAYERHSFNDHAGIHAAVWRANITVAETNLTITARLSHPGSCWVYAQGIGCRLGKAHESTASGAVQGSDGAYGTSIPQALPAPRLGVFLIGWDQGSSHSHVFTRGDRHYYQSLDSHYGDLYLVVQPANEALDGYVSCNVAGSNWLCCLQTYVEEVVADFSGTPTSGSSPLAVQFTDLSVGGATGWQWSFGDGESSNEQHPEHTYSASGKYTVHLNAFSLVWGDTETKTDYIEVDAGGSVPPPPTDPPTPTPPSRASFGMARPGGQLGALALGNPLNWLRFRQRSFSPPVAPVEFESPPLVPPMLPAAAAAAAAGQEASLERFSRVAATTVDSLIRGAIAQPLPGSPGEWRFITGGFAEEREPGANDDRGIGARAGVFWIERRPSVTPAGAANLPTQTERAAGPVNDVNGVWICVVDDAGEAVWVEIETAGVPLLSGGLP